MIDDTFRRSCFDKVDPRVFDSITWEEFFKELEEYDHTQSENLIESFLAKESE